MRFSNEKISPPAAAAGKHPAVLRIPCHATHTLSCYAPPVMLRVVAASRKWLDSATARAMTKWKGLSPSPLSDYPHRFDSRQRSDRIGARGVPVLYPVHPEHYSPTGVTMARPEAYLAVDP